MEFQVTGQTTGGRRHTSDDPDYLIDRVLGLFIVADGLGRHRAGGVASAMARNIVQRELINAQYERQRFGVSGQLSDLEALVKVVVSAVETACREIYQSAEERTEWAGMGTGLTLVLLPGHGKGIMAHVGNARLLLWRQQKLHQLSSDHILINEWIRQGIIPAKEVNQHPRGHMLSRVVGVQPSVEVDTLVFDIDPGDTYLLASYGLYSAFAEQPAQLTQRLAAAVSEQGLNQLVEGALKADARERVTALWLRFDTPTVKVESEAAAERRIALLQGIPIFSHLSYNELIKVVGLMRVRRVSRDTAIIREGEVGDTFYVLLAGEVTVSRGKTLLATLASGAYLGEMSMIDKAPRSATVTANCDATLLVMRREEFLRLMQAEPSIGTKLLWNFVQVISARLRRANMALESSDEVAHPGDEIPINPLPLAN